MTAQATLADVEGVRRKIEDLGFRPHIIPGAQRTAIGITGNPGAIDPAEFEDLPGVAEAIRVSKPCKLVSREVKPENTTVAIRGVPVGGKALAFCGGPCSVESHDQILESARAVKAAGAQLLRGGAYKPRTLPYAFQGLGEEGLRLLAEAKEQTGLPVVTELMDMRDIDAVLEVADVIQIGARNMQNYPLLAEVGRSGCATLLKRGLSSTLDELLMAAEYILKEGNPNVMLCERGIRTFETAYRFTLDLMAVPVLKELSHLPVIVDPSHAAGRRDLVMPLSLAAAAVGADGLIVEVHPNPDQAICDGPQQLVADEFADYVERVQAAAAVAGKALAAV